MPYAIQKNFWLLIGGLSLVGAMWHLQTVQSALAQSVQQAEALIALGRLEPAITESSGLARSKSVAGAFWTINDSGNRPELFLFSHQAEPLARCEIKSAPNKDWESMATWQVADQNYIVIGDVGDNTRKRKYGHLYFVQEPTIKPTKKDRYEKSLPAVGLQIRFDGGPINCEALGIDPQSNDVYFVEKQFAETDDLQTPGVFKLSLPADALLDRLRLKPKKRGGPIDGEFIATRIADFPVHGVTGMAFSPDGKRVIIRDYLQMRLFQRDAPVARRTVDSSSDPSIPNTSNPLPRTPSWDEVFNHQTPTVLPLPIQRQGEAICFSSDSKSIVVTSEKSKQTVWKIDLEELVKKVGGQ